MGDKVRLADIAEKTGVSIVSVSKALSGKGGVSRQKLEEIKKVAKELGYEPHTYAARHPSKNIGVVCRESYLTRFSSFYWQMYQDINKIASLMGSFAMLEVLTSDMEKNNEMPRILEEGKVDACIVIGNMPEKYLSVMRTGFAIPFVYLDFNGTDASMDCVVSDSFYGAYAMTNYLYDMGHTRIAYVGTLMATGSITDRYLGYQKSVLSTAVRSRRNGLSMTGIPRRVLQIPIKCSRFLRICRRRSSVTVILRLHFLLRNLKRTDIVCLRIYPLRDMTIIHIPEYAKPR